MFRLKLDFHLLAVVVFAFGSAVCDYSLWGRCSWVSCFIAWWSASGCNSAGGPWVALFVLLQMLIGRLHSFIWRGKDYIFWLKKKKRQNLYLLSVEVVLEKLCGAGRGRWQTILILHIVVNHFRLFYCIYWIFFFSCSCCSEDHFLCVRRETSLSSFGWETVKESQITPLVLLSALIVLLPGREHMSQPGPTLPDAVIYWVSSTNVCTCVRWTVRQ